MDDSKDVHNFSQDVRDAVEDSRAVAAAASASTVQPIHILHSLLKGKEAPHSLASFVDILKLRTTVAQAIGATPRTSSQQRPPYSAVSKRMLVGAMSEARELNHPFVGGHHLLLGILRRRPRRRLFGLLAPAPDPAYAVLIENGVSYDSLREVVLRAA